jgi:2-polyprenyl-6-methoxyphenol hydroxylase-like FAD-dependent oxidoreductase
MRTAIVVGAGIGGMTAAAALEQCGWQVTVLERADALGEVGAGISVWPGAVGVLEGLGIDGVRKGAAPGAAAGLRRPDGRIVVEAPDLGLEMPVMIHRARLHELITDAIGEAVTIRTGITVTEITQTATAVTVKGIRRDTPDTGERQLPAGAGEAGGRGELRVSADMGEVGGGRHEGQVLAGGSGGAQYEVFAGELVVVADGIRSIARESRPRYSGYTAYRGDC